MTEELAERATAMKNIVPMALVFEGGMAAVACAVGGFLKPPLWHSVVWKPFDLLLGLLATAPMLLGLFVLRRAKRGPLGRLNAVVDQFLIPLFSRCSVFQLALISAIAGIGEELLFRGVLQPVLIAWLGAAIGVFLAGGVFGLFHAVTPTYALLATLIGIYFGCFAHATGNLLGPIVAHGLYDFAALVYLTRYTSRAKSIPPAT